MRYCLVILVFSLLTLFSLNCEQNRSHEDLKNNPISDTQPTKKESPLLLDDGALLLLEDETNETASGDMADNSRCFVCHINYVDEKIAVVHARQDMGCAHCHGESDAHIDDESWASGGNGTAPDTIYAKDQVNTFCLNCHVGGELPDKEHKILFTNPPPKKYCTDCHGEHLLKERKTKWK
jgi:hypothetical protein